MYGGKHEYLINLGYTEENVNQIKLKLDKGNYTIDNIIVYARPKIQIENSINGLNRIAKNISYTTNKFEFDIKLEESESVFISIPYSSGWKAYVNGQKREIIKADDAFMVIPLEKRRI